MSSFLVAFENAALKIKRVHTLILFTSAAISFLVLLSTIFQNSTSNVVPLVFENTLSNTSTYADLIKCTDHNDGIYCFNIYKQALFKEARSSGVSPETADQLVECLGEVSSISNDLSMLLKIQECYHHAESFQGVQKFREPKNLLKDIAMLVSLVYIQGLAIAYCVLSYVKKGKEIRAVESELKDLRVSCSALCLGFSSLQQQITELSNKVKSEFSTVQGRLNRGGDVRRELDKVNLRLINLGYKRPPTKFQKFFGPSSDLIGTFAPAFTVQERKCKPSEKEQQSPVSQEESQLQNHPVVAQLDGHRFDLRTKEGMEAWREFCRKTPQAVQSSNPFSPLPQSSSDHSIGTSSLIVTGLDENKEEGIIVKSSIEKPLTTQGPTSVPLNVQRMDKNGKPYRRIFVPGQGWTSAKKLEENASS